jgi:hypothetical protein
MILDIRDVNILYLLFVYNHLTVTVKKRLCHRWLPIRSMVLFVYFIFSCRLWSLLLTTRTSFVLGFLFLFFRGHCFEGGNKGVWARKYVKYNWISQWTQICVYPCMEYICLCARNTVNNGSETQKHVK